MSFCEKVYRPTGRIVTRRIGEDRLLVPVSGGVAGENVVFPVNQTGLFVWEQLSAGKTVRETAVEMADIFAVDRESGLVDCEEIAQTFVNQKLLEAISL